MCAASVLGLQFFLVVWSLFSFFTYVFCFICIAFVFVVLFCYCLIFAFLLVFGALSAWLSVLLASVRLLISQNVVPSHGIRFPISRHHHRQAQAALWHLRAPSSFGGMVASLWFWELAPRLRLLSAPCNRRLQARLALPSLPGLARSHLEQVACLGLDKFLGYCLLEEGAGRKLLVWIVYRYFGSCCSARHFVVEALLVLVWNPLGMPPR